MARLASLHDKSSFSEEPSIALEEMMTHYGSTVLRTAFFYLGDRHLAEDASQEVFIRAYRHWAAFRGESSVKTWLTRITINLCRDKLGLKSNAEHPSDPTLFHNIERRSTEAEVMDRLDKTVILQHVIRLPKHYHEVIYLYYYLDLSTAEIADAIGSPEGTVRARLFRARELLREILEKEGVASWSGSIER